MGEVGINSWHLGMLEWLEKEVWVAPNLHVLVPSWSGVHVRKPVSVQAYRLWCRLHLQHTAILKLPSKIPRVFP